MCPVKNNFCLKISTFFTVIIYAVSCFHGSGLAFAEVQPALLVNTAHSFSIPSLPEYLGRVDLAPIGSGRHESQNWMLAIQDAHTSQDAQQKIFRILSHFKKKKLLDKVFLEGAWGSLDTTRLQVFNERSKNEVFWDELLKRGLIDGATRFLLSHPELDARGLEDPESYARNLKTFREVMGASGATDPLLDQIQVRVTQQVRKHLPPEVSKYLESRVLRFDEPEAFQTGMKKLFEDSEKVLQLDWKDPALQIRWPNLIRLHHLMEDEQRIDYVAAKIQWKQLEGLLQLARLPEAEILDIALNHRIQKSIPVMDARGSFRRLAERITEGLLRRGRSFEAYSDFFRFIANEIFHEELNVQELTREAQVLEDRLFKAWVTEPAGLHIVRIFQDLTLLRCAFHLELVPEKVLELRLRRETLRPSHFIKTLGLEGKRFALLEHLFPKVIDFYDQAKQREMFFEKSLQAALKDLPGKSPNQMAMISGGFHRPGLQSIFDRLGVPSAFILPRLSSETDSTHYRETLLGHYTAASTLSPIAIPLIRRDEQTIEVMGEPSFQSWKSGVQNVFDEHVRIQGVWSVRPKLPFGLRVSREIESERPRIRTSYSESLKLDQRSEVRQSFSWRKMVYFMVLAALIGMMPGCTTMGSKRMHKNLEAARETSPRQLEEGKTYLLNDETSLNFVLNSFRVQKAREEAQVDRALAKLKTAWSVSLKPQIGRNGDQTTFYSTVDFQGPLGKVALIAQNPVDGAFSAGFEGVTEIWQLALGKWPVIKFGQRMKMAQAHYRVLSEAERVSRDEGILRVEIHYLKGKQERLTAQVRELKEVIRPSAEHEYAGGLDTIRDLADMRKAVLDLTEELSETKKMVEEKETELRQLLFPNPEDQRHSDLQIKVTYHPVPSALDIASLQARATEGAETVLLRSSELYYQDAELAVAVSEAAEAFIKRTGSIEAAYLRFMDSVSGSAGSKAARNPLQNDIERRQYADEASNASGTLELGNRRKADAALDAAQVSLARIALGETRSRILAEIKNAVSEIELQKKRLADLEHQQKQVEKDLAEASSHSPSKMMKTRLNLWRIQDLMLESKTEIEINLRRLHQLRALDIDPREEKEETEPQSSSRSELRGRLKNTLMIGGLIGLISIAAISNAQAGGYRPSSEGTKAVNVTRMLLQKDVEAMKAAREAAQAKPVIQKVASLSLPRHEAKPLPSSTMSDKKKMDPKKSPAKGSAVKDEGKVKTPPQKKITPKPDTVKKSESVKSETGSSKVAQSVSQRDSGGAELSKGDRVVGVTKSGREIPGVVRSIGEESGKVKANIQFQPHGAWDAAKDPVKKIEPLKKENLRPRAQNVVTSVPLLKKEQDSSAGGRIQPQTSFRSFHWMGRQFSNAGKWIGRQFDSSNPDAAKEKKAPVPKKKKVDAGADSVASKGELVKLPPKGSLERSVMDMMFSNEPPDLRILPADELPPEMLQSPPPEESLIEIASGNQDVEDAGASSQVETPDQTSRVTQSAPAEKAASRSTPDESTTGLSAVKARGPEISREVFYSAPAAFAGFDRMNPGDTTLPGELFIASIDGAVEEVEPGKTLFQKGEAVYKLKSDRGLTTRVVTAPAEIQLVRWRAEGYVKTGAPVAEYYGANHFPARMDIPSGLVNFQGVSALLETENGQKIPAQPLWVRRGKVSGDYKSVQAVIFFQPEKPLSYWESPVKTIHLIRKQGAVQGASFRDALSSMHSAIYFAPVSLRVKTPVHAPSGGTFFLAKPEGSVVKAGEKLGVIVSASGPVNLLARKSGVFVGGYGFDGIDVVPGMRLGDIDEPEIQAGDPQEATLLVKANTVSKGQAAQVLLPTGQWLPGTVNSVTTPVTDQVRNLAPYQSVVVTARHPLLLQNAIQKGAIIGVLFSDKAPQTWTSTQNNSLNLPRYIPVHEEKNDLPLLVKAGWMGLGFQDLKNAATLDAAILSEHVVRLMLQAADNPFPKAEAFEFFTQKLKLDKFFDQLGELAGQGSPELSRLALKTLAKEKRLEQLLILWHRAHDSSETVLLDHTSFEITADLLKENPELIASLIHSASDRHSEVYHAAQNFFLLQAKQEGPNAPAFLLAIRNQFWTRPELVSLNRKMKDLREIQVAAYVKAESERTDALNRVTESSQTPSTLEVYSQDRTERMVDAETAPHEEQFERTLDLDYLSNSHRWMEPGFLQVLPSKVKQATLDHTSSLFSVHEEASEGPVRVDSLRVPKISGMSLADFSMYEVPEQVRRVVADLVPAKKYFELIRILRSAEMGSEVKKTVVNELLKTDEGTFYLADWFGGSAHEADKTFIYNSHFRTRLMALVQKGLQVSDPALIPWHRKVMFDALWAAYQREPDPSAKADLYANFFHEGGFHPLALSSQTNAGWGKGVGHELRRRAYQREIELSVTRGPLQAFRSVHIPGSESTVHQALRSVLDVQNRAQFPDALESAEGMKTAMNKALSGLNTRGVRSAVGRVVSGAEDRVKRWTNSERTELNWLSTTLKKALSPRGLVNILIPSLLLVPLFWVISRKIYKHWLPKRVARQPFDYDEMQRQVNADLAELVRKEGRRSELRGSSHILPLLEEMAGISDGLKTQSGSVSQTPDFSRVLYLVKTVINDPVFQFQEKFAESPSEPQIERRLKLAHVFIKQTRVLIHQLENLPAAGENNGDDLYGMLNRLYTLQILTKNALAFIQMMEVYYPLLGFISISSVHIPELAFDETNWFTRQVSLLNAVMRRVYKRLHIFLGVRRNTTEGSAVFTEQLREGLEAINQIEPHSYDIEAMTKKSAAGVESFFQKKKNAATTSTKTLVGLHRRFLTRFALFLNAIMAFSPAGWSIYILHLWQMLTEHDEDPVYFMNESILDLKKTQKSIAKKLLREHASPYDETRTAELKLKALQTDRVIQKIWNWNRADASTVDLLVVARDTSLSDDVWVRIKEETRKRSNPSTALVFMDTPQHGDLRAFLEAREALLRGQYDQAKKRLASVRDLPVYAKAKKIWWIPSADALEPVVFEDQGETIPVIHKAARSGGLLRMDLKLGMALVIHEVHQDSPYTDVMAHGPHVYAGDYHPRGPAITEVTSLASTQEVVQRGLDVYFGPFSRGGATVKIIQSPKLGRLKNTVKKYEDEADFASPDRMHLNQHVVSTGLVVLHPPSPAEAQRFETQWDIMKRKLEGVERKFNEFWDEEKLKADHRWALMLEMSWDWRIPSVMHANRELESHKEQDREEGEGEKKPDAHAHARVRHLVELGLLPNDAEAIKRVENLFERYYDGFDFLEPIPSHPFIGHQAQGFFSASLQDPDFSMLKRLAPERNGKKREVLPPPQQAEDSVAEKEPVSAASVSRPQDSNTRTIRGLDALYHTFKRESATPGIYFATLPVTNGAPDSLRWLLLLGYDTDHLISGNGHATFLGLSPEAVADMLPNASKPASMLDVSVFPLLREPSEATPLMVSELASQILLNSPLDPKMPRASLSDLVTNRLHLDLSALHRLGSERSELRNAKRGFEETVSSRGSWEDRKAMIQQVAEELSHREPEIFGGELFVEAMKKDPHLVDGVRLSDLIPALQRAAEEINARDPQAQKLAVMSRLQLMMVKMFPMGSDTNFTEAEPYQEKPREPHIRVDHLSSAIVSRHFEQTTRSRLDVMAPELSRRLEAAGRSEVRALRVLDPSGSDAQLSLKGRKGYRPATADEVAQSLERAIDHLLKNPVNSGLSNGDIAVTFTLAGGEGHGKIQKMFAVNPAKDKYDGVISRRTTEFDLTGSGKEAYPRLIHGRLYAALDIYNRQKAPNISEEIPRYFLSRKDKAGILFSAFYITRGVFRKQISENQLRFLLQELNNLKDDAEFMVGDLAKTYQIPSDQVNQLKNSIEGILNRAVPQAALQDPGVVFMDADLFSNEYLLELAQKKPGLVFVFGRNKQAAFQSFSAQLRKLKLPANVYAVRAEQGMGSFIRQALAPIASGQNGNSLKLAPELAQFLRKPGRKPEDFVVIGAHSDELKKITVMEIQNRYVMASQGLRGISDKAGVQFESHAALKYYGLLLFLHDENLFRMGSSGKIINVYDALSGLLDRLLTESKQNTLTQAAA